MRVQNQKHHQQELKHKYQQQEKKDERNKGVIFKNCAPFTGCISEMNNT